MLSNVENLLFPPAVHPKRYEDKGVKVIETPEPKAVAQSSNEGNTIQL